MKSGIARLVKTKITKDQCRDTGMAMVLLFLILFALHKLESLLVASVALHVVNMTVPKVYKPVAVVWLTLSEVLGAIVSRLVMSVVFFIVVTPIGILRRIAGKDSLKLRVFKSGQDSVMLERNHLFTAQDLERPY